MLEFSSYAAKSVVKGQNTTFRSYQLYTSECMWSVESVFYWLVFWQHWGGIAYFNSCENGQFYPEWYFRCMSWFCSGKHVKIWWICFPFAPITLKNSRLEIPTLEWSMFPGRKLIFCWFTNRSSPYWSGWSGNHQTFPELVAVHVDLPAFIYTWGILDWNNIEELSTVWLSDGSLYWNNKGENLVIASSSVPVDWNYRAIRGSERDSIPKASVLECSSTEWCQLDWVDVYCYTCFTTLYGNACYSVPFTSGPNGVICNVLVFLQLITSEYCNIHYYIPLLIADKVPLDNPDRECYSWTFFRTKRDYSGTSE